MPPAWIIALAPLAGQMANCVLQVIVFRLRRNGLLRSIIIGFGAGGIVTVTVTACGNRLSADSDTDNLARFLVNMLTFGALGYGYFHFINLGETARRIRILREIVEAGGWLDEAGLLRRYNAAEILHVRLARLLRSRQITARNGRYVLGSPTMVTMARMIGLLKRLLLRRERERIVARSEPV